MSLRVLSQVEGLALGVAFVCVCLSVCVCPRAIHVYDDSNLRQSSPHRINGWLLRRNNGLERLAV